MMAIHNCYTVSHFSSYLSIFLDLFLGSQIFRDKFPTCLSEAHSLRMIRVLPTKLRRSITAIGPRNHRFLPASS